jgi:hypothetical protein
MKFTFSPNPQTGLNETAFNAKLISIADTALQNANGKDYFPCTIEFTNASGQPARVGGIINKKNYDYGMTLGKSYLCRGIYNPEVSKTELLITVSHLEGATRATIADFGLAFEEVATDKKPVGAI